MKYINTFKYVYIIIIFQFLSFSRKINIFLIIFIKHNKISLHLNQVLLLDLVFPKHFIFNLINLIIDYKQWLIELERDNIVFLLVLYYFID